MAVGFAATTSILVTLVPFFNNVMGTAPLTMSMYLGIIIVSAVPTFVLSGIKKLVIKMRPDRNNEQLDAA
ncbi:cation-transporting ATPase [Lentilactobacillus farraginis DSM 18382 = JCM 14108]|uniref:Cation-transporting ATPase n=1 Tax=Lentilactobacillus farraginis DSM 18382 = JCM 14108 TaxID=1423743 RepID=X0QEG4_9LACO|nr:cation-transporting ATPase [Lentilactobacillus farraginis DSM 18382 = JCM 14108]